MPIPLLLAFLLLGSPALAQPQQSLTLAGQARTGEDVRAVRFVFLCSANEGPNVTGALGLELYVAGHGSLRGAFDFDAFEGPDARAGRLTQLETTAAGTTTRLRAMVSGWIGVDADAPFAFGLSAARRRDETQLREVSRLLRPLTAGAAQLVWTLGNTRPGGPSIVARLDVSPADAERLRTLLAPCLAR